MTCDRKMKTNTPLKEIVCKINLNTDSSASEMYERDIAYKYNFGETSFKKINFSGIRLLYGKLKFIKPQPVKMQSENPFIEMYFSLAGSRQVFFTQSDNRSNIARGHHNTFYIPDTEFYVEPSADEEENISLQIQLTEDYFKRFIPLSHPLLEPFIEQISKGNLSILSPCDLPITPEMYIVLNEIVHCEKEGIIKQLFIETHVLKLLQLQFEQYELAFVKKEQPVTIKEYDIEKLFKVKKMLDDNISYSHSLAELSRTSGLNDFKLKKGFKELFGCTVFSYLNDIRMKTAKKMLKETGKPIGEISEYCGYTYVQSFITAFKNKYGITPEKYRK